MSKWRALLKYGAIGTIISFWMILLSFFTANWVQEQTALPVGGSSRAMLIKQALERLPPTQRGAELGRLAGAGELLTFRSVYLLDGSGAILYPVGAVALPRSSEPLVNGSSGSAPRWWVDLEGPTPQYLILEREPPGYLAFGRRFTVTFIVLACALFIGVMAAIITMLYILRDRGQIALETMARIKRGDLKARLPVTRMDEFAATSLHFNQMAEEIETLVTSLRGAELSRTTLLRELAHDLRTPIAGLQSVVETLKYQGDRIPKEKSQRLLDLAEREIAYFGSLVEDLLVIGNMEEPSYRIGMEEVPLAEIVREELILLSHRFRHLSFSLEPTPASPAVFGNPKLLRRAVRNGLDNACHYARREVRVLLLEHENEYGKCLKIVIEDDGPGFTAEGLALFGRKRPARAVPDVVNGRISVGLGTVIMKSIVNRHRGSLHAENRKDSSGRTAGARVEIVIPTQPLAGDPDILPADACR